MCPKCANEQTRVAKTFKGGALVTRLRYCSACRYSFLTEEKPVFNELTEEEVTDYEEYADKESSKK